MTLIILSSSLCGLSKPLLRVSSVETSSGLWCDHIAKRCIDVNVYKKCYIRAEETAQSEVLALQA